MNISALTAQEKDTLLLNHVAKGLSVETSDSFYESLVEYLATILKADYAFVGKLVHNAVDQIESVAIFGEGHFMKEGMIYALAGTPCENVVGQEICVHATGVQSMFPRDEDLKLMRIDGYAGTPLFKTDGSALGIMAVLFHRPIEHVERVEAILSMFAGSCRDRVGASPGGGVICEPRGID